MVFEQVEQARRQQIPFRVFVVGFVLGTFLVLPAEGRRLRIGAVGDSVTDMVDPPGLRDYRPWIRWAVQDLGMDFGPWGQYPDFRGADYRYNYAHGGATTESMISEGQHIHLAAENPKVDLVSYCNGANDLAYWFRDHALWVAFRDNRDPETHLVPRMISHFNAAVNILAGPPERPTGTDLVIWGCPDILLMPKIRANLWAAYAGTPAKYRRAVQAYNQHLQAVAASRRWIYLDFPALGETLGAKRFFVLAGVRLAYNDFFCRDLTHPGPVFTGLMANLFARAVNRRYGTNYPLQSDQTILRRAGYSPPPGETYFDLDPYIFLNLPPESQPTNAAATAPSARREVFPSGRERTRTDRPRFPVPPRERFARRDRN